MQVQTIEGIEKKTWFEGMLLFLLCWSLFRLNSSSASFRFLWSFYFCAYKQHLCQNPHHRIRPVETLFDTFPRICVKRGESPQHSLRSARQLPTIKAVMLLSIKGSSVSLHTSCLFEDFPGCLIGCSLFEWPQDKRCFQRTLSTSIVLHVNT